MPIYEFQCRKCNQDSEMLVRSSDWEGTKCPHCGSVKLEKKLSVFASSGGSDDTAPMACGMGNGGGGGGGCGACCGGGPHRH